mmetsp:Transcript_17898/g.26799  ORF Transcript_17898/g.26799 Transcript_17898/m.26799 type:complete len:1277 (+) Transcript_17898:49-3879(+)
MVMRTSVALTMGMISLATIFSIYGLFQFPGGLDTVAKFYTSNAESIITVPAAERTSLQKVKGMVGELALGALFFGTGLDRHTMFTKLRNSYGTTFPFRDGLALTSYKDVEAALSQDSTRGQYIGAKRATNACFSQNTLIFVSNGPKHKALRDFMLQTIHGLHVKGTNSEGLVFPGDHTLGKNAPTEKIQETVIANVLFRIFGENPPENLVELATGYLKFGVACALGDVGAKMMPSAIKEVGVIRKAVTNFARGTEVGRKVMDKAKEISVHDDEAFSILQSIVDGVMFAGVLGTGQLTLQTLSRIREAPASELPLFLSNPENYLKESARLNPPVTSVTHVFPEETKVNIGFERKSLTVPAGATKQVIISLANKDPMVFGGPYNSKAYAEAFDPSRDNLGAMLSWNGLQADVENAVGPRWCLGVHLSIDLAKRIVTHFAPSTQSSPKKVSTNKPTFKESFELEQLVGLLSLGAFLIAGIVIYLRAYGRVARTFVHVLFALMLNRMGIVLNVKWLEYVARGYEVVSEFFLWILYASRRDRKGAISYNDIANILVRGIALVIFVVTIFRSHLSEYPSYHIISWAFVIPSRLALLSTFFQHWAIDGWLLVEFVGLLIALIMFTPVIEFTFAMLTEKFDKSVWVLFRMIFNLFVGLPWLSAVVITMDGVTAESIADEENSEFVTDAHRKKAADQGKKRCLEDWWFNVRFSATVVVIIAVATGAVLQNQTTQISDGHLCPFGVPEGLDSSLCKAGYLKDMDLHTRFMYMLTHYLYLDAKEDVPPSQVKIPVHQKLDRSRLGFGHGEMESDEALKVPQPRKESLLTLDAEGILAKITVGVHQYMSSMPLVDIDTPWPDIKTGSDIMTLSAGDDLPRPLADWDEMSSDNAISRICFAGLFAHRLELCSHKKNKNIDCLPGAKYFVDFTFMYGLKVRVPFERYGAAAFFNANQTLIGMYWSQERRYVEPKDSEWEHVKWAFKCSGLVGITAVDHLVGIHLIVANFLTQSTKTELSVSHPLRRLLEIHIHNTIEINAAAARTLCTAGGLVHHASALTEESLIQAYHLGVQTMRFDRIGSVVYAERMFRTGEISREQWPFGADYLDFYRILVKYVGDLVDLYYETDEDLMADKELVAFHDALHGLKNSHLPYLSSTKMGKKHVFVNTIAMAINGVTGFHNHIGMVGEYLSRPTYMAAKIRVGETHADMQSSFQCLNIAMLTGFKAPRLMGDYSHMLEGISKQEEATKVFERFQSDLKKFSEEIERRNTIRKYPCNAFNPSKILSSVSI